MCRVYRLCNSVYCLGISIISIKSNVWRSDTQCRLPCIDLKWVAVFIKWITIVFIIVSGSSVSYLVIRYQDTFLSAYKLGIQRRHHRRIHKITFNINYNIKIRFSFVNIEFWSLGIDHLLQYAPFTLRSCVRSTLLCNAYHVLYKL